MAVDLAERQSAAQREAARLARHLADLDGRLSAAVAAEQYVAAEEIKAEIAATRADSVMAQATTRAIGEVLAEIAQQEADRAAAEAAERRREEARAQLARAQAAEQEAEAEFARAWADIEPGLNAVRESLRVALSAEQAIEYARQVAYDAAVVLGDRPAGMRIFGPTKAASNIERDPLLNRIFHGPAGR